MWWCKATEESSAGVYTGRAQSDGKTKKKPKTKNNINNGKALVGGGEKSDIKKKKREHASPAPWKQNYAIAWRRGSTNFTTSYDPLCFLYYLIARACAVQDCNLGRRSS